MARLSFTSFAILFFIGSFSIVAFGHEANIWKFMSVEDKKSLSHVAAEEYEPSSGANRKARVAGHIFGCMEKTVRANTNLNEQPMTSVLRMCYALMPSEQG